MNLEHLPPITKAFIGYTPKIEPKFNLIDAYNSGMSINQIAINLDNNSQKTQIKINKLIKDGVLKKRQNNIQKIVIPSIIKAEAVYMIEQGATTQQAYEWVKKVSNHVPDKNQITKWAKQKSVQKALQKLEQKQATKH